MEQKNNKDAGGFMNKHLLLESHPGDASNFTAKVTHYNRDCLTRQIHVGVGLRRSTKTLFKFKPEWFKPPLVRSLGINKCLL